jgi:uncharacterized protein YdhG (YjbR/CyaY superfamily)
MKRKKKSTFGSRVRANAPNTVDAYLASVPEPARTTLTKLRAVIRSVVPLDATEVISYGIPTVRYKGALVAFAAFKDHCSLFPMGSSALDSMEADFKPYRVSKGTLHFPIDKAMPAALVKKLVRARIAQNEQRKMR